jgi:anti-sigma B factor antagonist
MPTDQLTIDVHAGPAGMRIFGLRGTLDMATAPSLRAALLECSEEGQHEIVVDLTRVDFIDSTGLGSLIGAQRRAHQHGGSLRLVVNEGPLSRLFHITGLVRVFGMYATLEDALRDTRRLVAQP